MITLIDETDSPTDSPLKRPLEGLVVTSEPDRALQAVAMLDKLNHLRKNKQFTDVILQVGSHQETIHEIYAHKVVLAAASPYLLEMFSCDAAPQQQSAGLSKSASNKSIDCEASGESNLTLVPHYPDVYKLHNISSVEAFELIIEFAYTGRLSIQKEQVKSVYGVANLLKMLHVSERCADYLVSSLSPHNALHIRSMPALMSDPFLLAAVDAYIRGHMSAILNSKDLERLPRMQIEMLLNTSEERSAINEKHLYNMILEWIRDQMGTERMSMTSMQEKIFMLYLNKDKTLHDCTDIEHGDRKWDSDVVQDYKRLSRRYSGKLPIEETTCGNSRKASTDPVEKGDAAAVNGHGSRLASNGSINGSTPTHSTQQPAKTRQFLFTRSDSEESLNSLADDDNINDWKVLASTSSSSATHSYVGILVVSAQLWLVSVKLRLNNGNVLQGAISSHSLNSIVRSTSGSEVATGCVAGEAMRSREGTPDASVALDSYISLASMSYSRCGVGVASFDEKLFVCGGYDRGECMKTCEMYDPAQNRWTMAKPMKTARGRFGVATIGSKVYAVGGSDGSRELSSIEEFDTETGEWSVIGDSPVSCSSAGICALGGKVYLVGGWSGNGSGSRELTSSFSYDPQAKTWSQIAPLNVGRYQMALTVLNDEIYAIGGCDSWTSVNVVEKYSPLSNSWTRLAPLPSSRRGCGAAVLNGRIYVAGGHDGIQSLCTVEIYSSVDDCWTTGPSLTACRANVGLVTVEMAAQTRLFAVGGFTGKNFLSSIEFIDGEGELEWTSCISRHLLSIGNPQEESFPVGEGSHESSVSRSSSIKSSTGSGAATSVTGCASGSVSLKKASLDAIMSQTIDEVEGESGNQLKTSVTH